VKLFIKDESGTTAIEYCLIGAAIAVALVASYPSVTAALSTKVSAIAPMITNGK
jgi:Flp pilus assembly pilin Flp